MKLTIDIPDVVCDREGNRYEPTGDFRLPVTGDKFFMHGDHVGHATGDYTSLPCIILRPVWTWPDALKGWGIAADRDGQLWWHEKEAILDESEWDSDGEIFYIEPAATMLGFTPPTIHDWTKPILNPRWKGSADAH